MSTDLFKQLAELEVPPPPPQFDEQLHDRVNRALVAGQLTDLLVGALPWALLHFGRAVVGALYFTLAGRYDTKSRQKP